MGKISIVCEISVANQQKHPFIVESILTQNVKKYDVLFWDTNEGQPSQFFKNLDKRFKNFRYTSNKNNTFENTIQKTKNNTVIVINEDMFMLPNFLKFIIPKVNKNVVYYKSYYSYNVYTKRFIWMDLNDKINKLYNNGPICFSKSSVPDFKKQTLFQHNDNLILEEQKTTPKFFSMYSNEDEKLLTYVKSIDQPTNPAMLKILKSMDEILNSSALGIKEVEIQNVNNSFYLKVPEYPVDELPKVSVVTVTKNRTHLFEFTEHIWHSFKYPRNKLEWVIIDDSDKEMDLEIFSDANVKYVWLNELQTSEEDEYIDVKKTQKYTIGQKRNIGVEKASNDFIVMMDDDDYYYPDSILAKMRCLLHYMKEDRKCLLSSPCGFYNTQTNRSHIGSRNINISENTSEASLAFHRDFWNESKFGETQFTEGKPFVLGRENKMVNLPFWFNFVAFTHGNNATDNLRNLSTPYDEGAPNFFDFFDITTKEVVKKVFSTEDSETTPPDETI